MITKFTKILLLVAICFTVNSISAQVYWGENPGEGDFDGGLNGWTVNNIEGGPLGWEWNATGTLDNGGGITPEQGTSINSPTASNGAMTLNADAYSFPNGYVAPPFPVYISELISPDIDLTAVPVGTVMAIEFNQFASFFAAADGYFFTSFAVSSDGGVTWSDDIDCNENIEQYTGANQVPGTNNVVKLGIPLSAGLAGSSTVKVKFTFAATLIFWVIDDVKIVARDAHDIRVQSNFYAIAPSYRTPLSQAEPFGFLADVFNAGANVATNAELQMEITGGSSTHNESVAYPDMVPDSLYENVSWGAYTPDVIGNYNGTYTLVSDFSSEDATPNDNSISYDFAITDSTYAKEAGPTRGVRPAEGNWGDMEDRNWGYGNHYYITNGEGYEMTTAGIYVTGGAGLDVGIYLYKWIDDNMDGNCDPTERNRVGFAFHSVTTGNLNTLLSIPMDDFLNPGSGSVPLEDNTNYVLMVEYSDTGAGNTFTLGASEDYDYGAAVLNSEQMGAPRYAGMLGIAEDFANEAFSSVGFGTDIVPVVRMHVNQEVMINTNDVLSADNILEVSPSPASEFININIDLVETHTDALLRVLDVTGKVVERRVFSELQNQQLTFDVSDWTPGSYFLNLSTKEGFKTYQFIVKH